MSVVDKGAFLSDDRKYRYALWRRWEQNAPYVMFIGLNPSTADEQDDDPTLRRCMRFAADWGYGAIYMLNLFALRATDPKIMLENDESVGVENDRWLKATAQNAALLVGAWGAHGGHKNRNGEVLRLLKGHKLMCLGVTKTGHPRHPLYIKADKNLETLKLAGA